MYLFNALVKYLPDDKDFGCVAKYCAHLKHLCWSLNQNVLADIQDHNTGSPSPATDIDQSTCIMWGATTR